MIFLVAAAALLAGAPLIAALLVSVASVREDAAKSLAGFPPGPLARAVRRLLQASVGGSGPREKPHRVSGPTRRRARSQAPRSSQLAAIPAPRRPADDEEASRSPGALTGPRS